MLRNLRLARLFSTARDPHDFYARIGAKPQESKHEAYDFSIDALRESTSPSYFTGRPVFYDALYDMDVFLHKYRHILNKNQPLESRSNMKWASMSKITGTWGVKVSVDEQKQLTQKLGQLARIEGLAKDEKLTDFLDRFRMEDHALVKQESNTTLDEWGRAYAVGYRRRVKAHVWLSKAHVEGEGKMLIEGQEMTDYFPRFTDRAQVCLPFEVTGSIGSYNIWCKLESSVPGALGHTAVSGAIANGVANALLVFKNHTAYLNAVKLLKPDLRQRESKKPGQPSSRAKFQWVKR